MSTRSRQAIRFLCYKNLYKKQVLQLAICQWRFPEQRSFYLTEERQLCARGIRNSLSCRNPNTTNLKEQRNHFLWYPWKRLWLDCSFRSLSRVPLQHVVLQQTKIRKSEKRTSARKIRQSVFFPCYINCQ